jgi:hypothetical protein
MFLHALCGISLLSTARLRACLTVQANVDLPISESAVVEAINAQYDSIWTDSRIGCDPATAASEHVVYSTYKHWVGFPSDYSTKLHQVPLYTNEDMQPSLRFMLARLRTGCHQLRIHTGRFERIQRHLRVCQVCSGGAVEDLRHFLMECDAYTHVRQTFYSVFAHGSLIITTKFVLYFENQCLLAKCVEQMLQHRQYVLSQGAHIA